MTDGKITITLVGFDPVEVGEPITLVPVGEPSGPSMEDLLERLDRIERRLERIERRLQREVE